MVGDRSLVPVDHVERAIVAVRGHKVLLDGDLAAMYGVPVKALNQAAKRNESRFPADFRFQLTAAEAARLRSHSVTLDVGGRGQHRKYLPWAFTEHGALMVASVLNSPRAVQMSIFVVRAFVRLRDWLAGHAELAGKLAELECRVAGHDEDLKAIVQAIRQLTQPPATPRRRIGFRGADPR
jgi:hypothetical protein